MKKLLLSVFLLSHCLLVSRSLNCFKSNRFNQQSPIDRTETCTDQKVCVRYVELKNGTSQIDAIGCGTEEECTEEGEVAKSYDSDIEYYCISCNKDKCIPTIPSNKRSPSKVINERYHYLSSPTTTTRVEQLNSLKCLKSDQFDYKHPINDSENCVGDEVCVRFVVIKDGKSYLDTIGCGTGKDCTQKGHATKSSDSKIEYYCVTCTNDKCIPISPTDSQTPSNSERIGSSWIPDQKINIPTLPSFVREPRDDDNMTSTSLLVTNAGSTEAEMTAVPETTAPKVAQDEESLSETTASEISAGTPKTVTSQVINEMDCKNVTSFTPPEDITIEITENTTTAEVKKIAESVEKSDAVTLVCNWAVLMLSLVTLFLIP